MSDNEAWLLSSHDSLAYGYAPDFGFPWPEQCVEGMEHAAYDGSNWRYSDHGWKRIGGRYDGSHSHHAKTHHERP
jgi:hypothetical protein